MPACLQAFLLAEPCPGSREHWPAWGQEVALLVPLSSGGLLSERGPCSSVMNIMVVPTCPELETFFLILSNMCKLMDFCKIINTRYLYFTFMSAFCPVNSGQCLCLEMFTVGGVEVRVWRVLSPLCTQLERSYQRFTAFYASRHSGRKLTWLYQLSKGELVTNCFKNRYTLQVRSLFILEVFFFNTKWR